MRTVRVHWVRAKKSPDQRIVSAVAEDVSEFQVGDRVACAGVGFASHAEVLSVPKNLCVHLPEQVGFDAGAYGTLGAIALQGVRLAEPTLGESVVVIGLGLVGQLTVQLLKANGCRVFGLDLDPARVALARELGADQATEALSHLELCAQCQSFADEFRSVSQELLTVIPPSLPDSPVRRRRSPRRSGRVVHSAPEPVGIRPPNGRRA